MWQRIQTLFLALVASSMVASLFLPLFEIEAFHQIHAFSIQLGTYKKIVYLGVGPVLVAVVSVVALFLYRNRPLQLRLCSLNFLLIGASFMWIIYQVDQYLEMLGGPEGRYSTGAYAIIVGMLMNLLARYFIQRDERLVRNADRLL